MPAAPRAALDLRFAWWVALRYLREGRSQTWLIFGGVAVGVGVMVFLSALLTGLQASLIDKTLGSQAHVVVKPPEDAVRWELSPDAAVSARLERAPQRVRSIEVWQQVLIVIDRVPGVVATSPELTGSAFASRGSASKSVALRGVDPARFDRIVHLSTHMSAGTFSLVGAQAVIGRELAASLGVTCNDKIRIATPGRTGETFLVTGVFDLGNKDVNERWVLVPLRPAQALLDLPGGVSTIEVAVDHIFDADATAAAIAAATGLSADSWMTINRQLMIGLSSQSSSGYMIQMFVIIAVALGIASVLAVSVVQKSSEIGILRAIGTSRGQILRVFLIQGGLLGAGGAVLGCGLGALLAELFARMAKNPDGSPTFPVAYSLRLFLVFSAIAAVTGLVAAILPARRAARLDPAVAIRHG